MSSFGCTSVVQRTMSDVQHTSEVANEHVARTGNWTDWHYTCKFGWYPEEPDTNVTAAELAPRSHTWLDPGGWTLGSLQADLRRNCIDDMNRMVLQLLFNDLCNRRD